MQLEWFDNVFDLLLRDIQETYNIFYRLRNIEETDIDFVD